MKIWSTLLVVALALTSVTAEAKRLGGGGGKSFGQQSSNVKNREAAKPAPAANPAPAAAPAVAPAAPAAAPSRFGGMGGMLGGLAAGMGLAWLAHSMGFGAEFGQFLMFGLLALVVMVVIGAVMRRRQQPAAANTTPFAFEGAGAPVNPSTLPQYNPKNVGNDSSARPIDTTPDYAPAAAGGSMIGSALSGNQAWGIPAGFDTAGFVNAAKGNFMTLQRAWDSSDISTLRSMMTDTMLDEIKAQLAEREATANGQVNHTEVVMLEAQLLGIEEVDASYMASVEFSGLIREDASSGPTPFREVWNMTKPKDGSLGWLVAGVQALQ